MPAFPEEFFFSTIGELHAKLEKREVSCRDLTRAYLDRLRTVGPQFNALVTALEKPAMREAKLVDRDLKKARTWTPLQGVPYGAKDLLAVAGFPTTWGAEPYKTQTFPDDATVIKKLRKTGAICIGKLAMVELAGGGFYRYAAASATGPGLNPWDRKRWAGGSSSGSGAAVAAGLVPFALGSETNGSILTPATFCGVTGLRPTYGYVPRTGAMALSWTMDKIGPLARSVEDCALVLQAVSGGDDDDPGSAGKSFYHTPQFARPFSDLTIGFAPTDFADWPHPDLRPALNAALNVFRSFGSKIVEVELPDLPYGPVAQTIISGESAAIFEDLVTSGQVDRLADQKQIAGLKAGQELLAKDYLKAMRIRRLIQQAFRDLFVKVDVLISPGRNITAPLITQPLDQPIPGAPTGLNTRGLQALISASNVAGLPALCLPAGFANNLPVAIQLVGRPFTENTLIAFGSEFQKRTDWHRRRPQAA